eukprot:GGOE01020594.1.p1 GENE.GGOE01020594.1~~GGOE01020594.1.p1  ORF type:complete len:1124 (+),score=217.87 GGOE01020594.1:46-3417(+)
MSHQQALCTFGSANNSVSRSNAPNKLPPVNKERGKGCYGEMETAATHNPLFFKVASPPAARDGRPGSALLVQSFTSSGCLGNSSVYLSTTQKKSPCAERAAQIRDEIFRMNLELRNLEEEAKEEEAKQQQLREQEELRQLKFAKEEADRHRKSEEELGSYLDDARRDRRMRKLEPNGSPKSDLGNTSSVQSPQSLRSFIEENESLRRSRQGFRNELQAMYAELEELQQPSWVKKQRAREKVAAAERMQAIDDLQRERRQLLEGKKVTAIRREIESLHVELAALERQERLASERRQAAEDYECTQHENESERQAQYMETCRARASRTNLSTPAEVRRPSSTTGVPTRRLSELSPLPRLMTPPPASPSIAQSLFSDTERQSLRKEDLTMQKARQKRDLDTLRHERAVLLQDEAEDARLDIHRSLARQLNAEAAQYKASPHTPIRPQSALHKQLFVDPMNPDLNPKKPLAPLSPIGKAPGNASGSPRELLAQLQRELKYSVAEMEADKNKKAEETQALFAQHEAEHQRIDEEWASRSIASWANARERDLHLHHEELQRQKGEVSKLRDRLRRLEDEDMEAKARAAEAERMRFAALQAELAAELERQQTLATRPREENPGEREALKTAEGLVRRVERARVDRIGEQARWSQSMATHPEFQDAPPQRGGVQNEGERQNNAARRIQAFFHHCHYRRKRQRIVEARQRRRLEEERMYAARLIQGVKRMRQARLEAEGKKQLQKQTMAAIQVQGLCRMRLAMEEAQRRRRAGAICQLPDALKNAVTPTVATTSPKGSLGVAVAALSTGADGQVAADILQQLQAAFPNIMAVMAVGPSVPESAGPTAGPGPSQPSPQQTSPEPLPEGQREIIEEVHTHREVFSPPITVETDVAPCQPAADEDEDIHEDECSALGMVYAAVHHVDAALPPESPFAASDFEEFPNIMAIMAATQLGYDDAPTSFMEETTADTAALQLRIEVTEVSMSVRKPPGQPVAEEVVRATAGADQLIRMTNQMPPTAATAAISATRIQAMWRGFHCRSHLLSLAGEGRPRSTPAGSGVSLGYSSGSFGVVEEASLPVTTVSPSTLAQLTLRERYRDVVEEEAATLIQAQVRSRLARKATSALRRAHANGN